MVDIVLLTGIDLAFFTIAISASYLFDLSDAGSEFMSAGTASKSRGYHHNMQLASIRNCVSGEIVEIGLHPFRLEVAHLSDLKMDSGNFAGIMLLGML